MSNEIIETPVPLSNIEGGGVITDIDTKIGTVDDEATGSVLGKLNYLMENIGKGGLKSKVLVDVNTLDDLPNQIDIGSIYPTLYSILFELDVMCDEREFITVFAMWSPFNDYAILSDKDGNNFSSELYYGEPAYTFRPYVYKYPFSTTRILACPDYVFAKGTLTNIDSITTYKVTAYYFDSTPVDTE